MKRLIVSADDFGLTKSVNEGIVKAVREGIVTSVNLIPTGEALEDAVRRMRDAGIREAGAHLALTETAPLTDRTKIPTLIAGAGRFPKGYVPFMARYLFGQIDLDQAYIELKSQMDALDRLDIKLTNLSSHQHIHMLPAILDIFVKLAKEYDVPAIRYVHEKLPAPAVSKKIYKGLVASYFSKTMARVLKASSIIHPDRICGFLDSGALDEAALLRIVGALDEGTTELVSHPGFLSPEILDRYTFHKNCEAELAALTGRRVKALIKDTGVTLIAYGELLSR